MSESLARDVQAVRDHIAVNGWNQGAFYGREADGVTYDGTCCLEGAARQKLLELSLGSYARFIDHVAEQIVARGDIETVFIDEGALRYHAAVVPFANGSHYTALIPHFNDRVLKTKDEVLEFLDKAVIAAQEKA